MSRCDEQRARALLLAIRCSVCCTTVTGDCTAAHRIEPAICENDDRNGMYHVDLLRCGSLLLFVRLRCVAVSCRRFDVVNVTRTAVKDCDETDQNELSCATMQSLHIEEENDDIACNSK